MFTFKPNGSNGQKSSNGHSSAATWLAPKNGNGHGNGHGKTVESVLGPEVHYKGTLAGTGGVRIEGSFDGTIAISGPLVVTDGARVTAEIQAGAVSVAGSVKGNITAGKVEILATGRIWGDLTTSAFATEEGAFLRGLVKMEDNIPAPTAAEAEPEETAA